MAITNFIPEIWAAELLQSLKKGLVYGQSPVVNTDYEGEITGQGDTVKVSTVGAPTVFDYTANSDMPAVEELTTAQRSLVIDTAKGFNFQVDDVDAAQVAGDVMGGAMTEAAYALRDEVDQAIAGLYTDVDAGNAISTTSITTGVLAYDGLVDLNVLLSESNVPTGNRWAVVPPWYAGLLRQSSNFVAGAAGAIPGTDFQNGVIGTVDGLTVYESNNAPLITGDDYAVLAGYPGAISHAQQIASVEAYRPEGRFADALKGLLVFGSKVMRPTGLAVLTASKS